MAITSMSQAHTDRKRLLRLSAFLLATSLLVFSAGCAIDLRSVSENESGAALQGRVRGGQQPVSGAAIHLYAAGSSVGSGATDLLAPHAVATNAAGYFNITGDYTCPTPNTQVYLVATGGNPGLATGQTNPALALMAALGNCGSLTSSTVIQINEATTVAAAWALAQFLGPGAQIGATSTNSTGLANAFAVAANLADTSTGLAPGASLPAGAATETAKLYTLADVLASCINSDGGTACTPLFTAATVAGIAPTNTLDAARNIVLHPTANIAAVFNAAGAQGPFQPTLSAAPHDWTMSITYSGGGLNTPGDVAVDSAGSIAVANYFGGIVSKFSPTGVPAAASGFPGTGLSESYGIAIDASDNIWVTNQQSVTSANNQHKGSVSEFSSAGAELSGYGYTSGGLYYPIAIVADSSGAIWVADYGDSSATLLNGDGSAVSGSGGYAASSLPFVSAVALDSAHNAWFAVQGGAARVTPAGVVNTYSCCGNPAGIAVDGTGNVWIADYNGSAIDELDSTGVLQHTTTLNSGNAGPRAIAVDGAGNIWAGNYYGNSLAELSGTTAAVTSPAAGFGLDAPLSEPYGLAIDASGNLWLSNSGSNTLTQFVGLAAPVRTPQLGPSVQP
ncbi:MAG TPA: NHL repeat-containing protein [Acidobacteriaceae bacterium]|nr:NHL repeat-containing protein [Acidobacteriaceae bacterium]